MVCLKARSISKCHLLLQLALVMILLIYPSSVYSRGYTYDRPPPRININCYMCKNDARSCNTLRQPLSLNKICSAKNYDAFCYIFEYNGKVERGSKTCGFTPDMLKRGKLCKCYTNKCNGFNVTKESDLDKCVKETKEEMKENSAVGQSDHYSNVIGFLISLCGITLWFVITNVNSIGGFDGGPGSL